MYFSDEEQLETARVWPVFADLMACMFGVFVLLFVWMLTSQINLTENLLAERAQRLHDATRLETLERALAGPLAEGRITLTEGKIGIRGSVLFELNSADLTADGLLLLRELAAPLKSYADEHDQLIMVSGFTDDLPIHAVPGGFKDNWELSAQRALNVTRTLASSGVSSNSLFAAGFGDSHPSVPNSTPEGRAQNRRVEICPVPRQQQGQNQGQQQALP